MSDAVRTVLSNGIAKDERSPIAVVEGDLSLALQRLKDERVDLLRQLQKNAFTWARLTNARDALLGASSDD